jgi:hypothetical protein
MGAYNCLHMVIHTLMVWRLGVPKEAPCTFHTFLNFLAMLQKSIIKLNINLNTPLFCS